MYQSEYSTVKEELESSICKNCNGVGRIYDAEPGDISYNEWVCPSCGGRGFAIKVYIAAPFFTPEQLAIVEAVELELTSLKIPFFSPRSAGVLKDMSEKDQKKSRREIYYGNIMEMEKCTHMIACVEHKDTGTTFEIGYYAAKQKPFILYSEKIGTVNVMLAEPALAVCDNIKKISESLFFGYTAEIKSLT